jgi:hypothetical protein
MDLKSSILEVLDWNRLQPIGHWTQAFSDTAGESIDSALKYKLPFTAQVRPFSTDIAHGKKNIIESVS